jgi:hypothetical protein
MPLNEWLLAAGLILPLAAAVHLLLWQKCVGVKRPRVSQGLAALLFFFWLGHVAAVARSEIANAGSLHVLSTNH